MKRLKMRYKNANAPSSLEAHENSPASFKLGLISQNSVPMYDMIGCLSFLALIFAD
jgi:hypothetical protein